MEHLPSSPNLIPPEFRNSDYSYFYRNVCICISLMRICSYTEHNWKQWLYYQGFDRIRHEFVLFEGHVHRLRYDQTVLRN